MYVCKPKSVNSSASTITIPFTLIMNECRVKNYLGGHKFLTDRSFELLVTFIGILVLIIALAAVLFALGLVISLIQLTARIGCNTIFNRDVFGMSVQSLCIQYVPFCLFYIHRYISRMHNAVHNLPGLTLQR